MTDMTRRHLLACATALAAATPLAAAAQAEALAIPIRPDHIS